jgi:hypothetical protein
MKSAALLILPLLLIGQLAGAAYARPAELPMAGPPVVWEAWEEDPGAEFGKAVASAGDVDGDGYDDVAAGANNYRPGGRVRVYATCAAQCLRAAQVKVSGYPVGADYQMVGRVVVQDENGEPLGGVEVQVVWRTPDLVFVAQSDTTNAAGVASFSLLDGPGGYLLELTGMTLAGYQFDPVNSVQDDSRITP